MPKLVQHKGINARQLTRAGDASRYQLARDAEYRFILRPFLDHIEKLARHPRSINYHALVGHGAGGFLRFRHENEHRRKELPLGAPRGVPRPNSPILICRAASYLARAQNSRIAGTTTRPPPGHRGGKNQHDAANHAPTMLAHAETLNLWQHALSARAGPRSTKLWNLVW